MIVEYESLILGLRAAKYLCIQLVSSDSELIVQQVKDVYRVKQTLLKVYHNEVWDLIGNFFLAFNITYILVDRNQTTYSLDLEATYTHWIWKQLILKFQN